LPEAPNLEKVERWQARRRTGFHPKCAHAESRLFGPEFPQVDDAGRSGGDVTLAVQAMKAGAVDWLETPYEKDELLAAVASAMDNIQQTTNEQRERESALRRIAGMSARARQVFDGLLAGGTNKTIGKQLGISPAHGGNASRQRHGAARRPHLARSRAGGGGGGHPPAARARSNAFR
jgi:hypothetical protein